MIKALFLKVVNMSITASVVILVIIAIRCLLKKQPKIYSYMLWGIVLFRLLCPYSLSLDTSLFNFIPPAHIHGGRIEFITEEIIISPQTQSESKNETIIPVTVAPQLEQQLDMQQPEENMIVVSPQAEIDWIYVIAVIWFFGTVYMVLNNLISLYEIKLVLNSSTHISDNIYVCRFIPTAFIMGIIRPKIYLPDNLSDKQREFILLHEQTHIRRGDYLFKIFGFTAVAIHWFNPLVWLGFKLAENDMEMACDEAVIKKLGTGEKAGYSQTLLNISMPKPKQPAMHLAFGEGDTKERIINVLNYKKPAFIGLISISAIMLLSVTALAFNPTSNNIRKTIKLSDENIIDAIVLQDIKYMNIDSDDIPLLLKNLKRVKISQSEDSVINTEDGYAYIMLSTETDELEVNFNQDFSQMWLTGENGETSADNIVYDVINPDYIAKMYSDLFNSVPVEKEIVQVIFPFEEMMIEWCDICKNTSPFVVRMELPDGWRLDNRIHDSANFLAALDKHHCIAITNSEGDVVGSIGFNTANENIKSVKDICNSIFDNYGYIFNQDNFHILHNECETAVTEYTSDAFPDLHKFAVFSMNSDIPVYVFTDMESDKIQNYQLEEIAQSIEIEPIDNYNTQKRTTFFIKPDETESVMGDTAVKVHLKTNLGFDDFSVTDIKTADVSITSAPFEYESDVFTGYDYVVKADYSYSDTNLTSLIYIKKTDDSNYEIVGSVENDMIYDPYNIQSTYTETINRPIEILPEIVTEKDDTMTLGTTEIASYGEPGMGFAKVEVTYKNGVVIDEQILDTITLRKATPTVMKQGTVWNGTVIQGGSGKLIWPTAAGYISRGFVGQYPEHNGIDIAGPNGTYIYAADSGVVTKALYTNVGYGVYCVIEHGGYQTLYGHCSELLVSAGQEVQKGQIIAKMGATGNATGNNLHFEVKKGNTRYNPYSWF
ncbi:MAG: peptidoglycan DD-metalloendopeptidase family protein [Oscillospiraceae bacterium]|nr:peptidoglycan DD-metalloendopeptidase family protein [Oscillospiraceae bacterium]